MSEIRELLEIARKAAAAAAQVIVKYFESDLSVEWKPDNTPVTIADKKAEETLRGFFARETPDFGCIGEEFGIENPKAEFKWVFDPIDGTKSFIRGVPLFGTLVGLYRKGEPLLGIIGLPAMNRTLYAGKSLGAFVDGKSVHVSKTLLSKGLALSGTVNTFENLGMSAQFDRYRKKASLYRGWGDCYGYFLVATGRAEAMADPVVSLWDIAAFPTIFSEAGGRFSCLDGSADLFDADGNPNRPIHEGYTALAANMNAFDGALGCFR